MREQQAEHHRGEQIATRIAGLQDARYEPARFRRNALHRQRGTHAPLAAHGDAEQGAQHQQHGQAGRKAGEQFDDRIRDDVDHQGRPTSDLVGESPEYQCAHGAHKQGK